MELGNLNLNTTSSNSQESPACDSEWTVEQEDEYNRYMDEGDDYGPRSDLWDAQQSDSTAEEKTEQLQAIQQRNKNYSAPIMPREELARCMRERLCLRCKKPNHIARFCPLPHPSPPSQFKRNFH